MHRNLSPLIFLATLVFSVPLPAADGNGLFAIRGAGLLTCEVFVRERSAKSDAYTMIGGWLDGYLTAINELSQDTFDIAPHESTELFTILINRHCAKNPTDTVYAVTNALLARLHDKRLKKASDYVDVRVGQKQIRLYRKTIVRIQQALSFHGFPITNYSGLWTQNTTTALASYQQSVGLKTTGFPDQVTLWHLLQSH